MALPTAAAVGAGLGAALGRGRGRGHPWIGWLAVATLGGIWTLALPHAVGAQRLLMSTAVPLLDLLNHRAASDANCSIGYEQREEGNRFVVRTKRAVARGTELFSSYGRKPNAARDLKTAKRRGLAVFAAKKPAA